MQISIFGLGYVGAVSAGCLGELGHSIVGVDLSQHKVDMLNKGLSPIVEPKLEALLAKTKEDDRLIAICNINDAYQRILDTEISLVCVGTPSNMNGSLDLAYVETVTRDLAQLLRDKDTFHSIVIRSTMLPGSMRNMVIPVLEEASGKKAGVDFGVCINPEFLREGTAVSDFFNPPKTVIGELCEGNADYLVELYSSFDAPLIRVDLETAEMVKYSDNAWHALKVCYANEIGNICKSLGIDSHRVMDIFCQDTKLNLSPYYLKPGFAFGGSCLPKDLKALIHKAHSLDISVPVLESITPSNKNQIELGIERVLKYQNKKIGVLGFSFKAGTDDLRESPIVEMIERLLGKGFDILIYDENVNVSKLVGANLDYLLNRIPHVSKLMVDQIDDVLDFAETLVIGNTDPAFAQLESRLTEDQVVIDLVRITDTWEGAGTYDGLCW